MGDCNLWSKFLLLGLANIAAEIWTLICNYALIMCDLPNPIECRFDTIIDLQNLKHQ